MPHPTKPFSMCSRFTECRTLLSDYTSHDPKTTSLFTANTTLSYSLFSRKSTPMPMQTSTKRIVGMHISFPTDDDESSGSSHSTEGTTKNKQHRVSRRHSMAAYPISLKYNTTADDELESSVLDDPRVVFEQHQMIRQDSHLSEPLLSLGNLAELLMPPKILVDDPSHLNKKMTSNRRQSCCF